MVSYLALIIFAHTKTYADLLVQSHRSPYAAYCPHGAGKPVMGRHKRDFNAEGELYAPVFGSENHWVMIGQKGENSATTCMSHYQLEGSNPSWGLTTERSELKKYVMCCTMNTSV